MLTYAGACSSTNEASSPRPALLLLSPSPSPRQTLTPTNPTPYTLHPTPYILNPQAFTQKCDVTAAKHAEWAHEVGVAKAKTPSKPPTTHSSAPPSPQERDPSPPLPHIKPPTSAISKSGTSKMKKQEFQREPPGELVASAACCEDEGAHTHTYASNACTQALGKGTDSTARAARARGVARACNASTHSLRLAGCEEVYIYIHIYIIMLCIDR
jgi:hypothetical protein